MCSDMIQWVGACAFSIASPAGGRPRGRHDDRGGKKGEGCIGRLRRIYVTVDDGC